jgi:RNA polymerase sigma-70 factor (ECF subfamily)
VLTVTRMEEASQLSRTVLAEALARVARGDQAALELLYRQTSAKLYGVCLRILRDRTEAEEVLQEVFVTIWKCAEAYEPAKGSALTWLAAIARNRSIDRLRGRKSRLAPVEEAEALADPQPLAGELLETDDRYRKLAACLEGLEPRTASAIREAFFDGSTYEALALRSATPLGTMKSRIRRGLMALRASMDS